MPAYNEADGIAEFLREAHGALTPLADHLEIVVADDRSTDATAAVVADLDLPGVRVITQQRNRGHGPTALAAYAVGLDSGAEIIVHVDGDGQFSGDDIARVVRALRDTGAEVVHGVRSGRTDPWFRKALTGTLRLALTPIAHRQVPDINTPLRAYRPAALRVLSDTLGPDAEVPHVHFSLAEARGGFVVRYVSVAALPRRGDSATGTMWGVAERPPVLPPPRLRAFVRRALKEVWVQSLAPSAPMRTVRRAPESGRP